MSSLLLIEDDPHFSQVLSRTLERHQYNVRKASTCMQALHELATEVPDAAIIDMKLAEGSGLELIKPLREANAAMRIVMLTGYASIATTVEAIKRGADDYLTKPVEIDSLLQTLKNNPPQTVIIPEEPMSLRRLEWEHIQRVLHEHHGNISAAARTLGMHRRTLQRRLAKRPVKK